MREEKKIHKQRASDQPKKKKKEQRNKGKTTRQQQQQQHTRSLASQAEAKKNQQNLHKSQHMKFVVGARTHLTDGLVLGWLLFDGAEAARARPKVTSRAPPRPRTTTTAK